MQTGARDQGLQRRTRGRVPIKYGLDVFFDIVEHTVARVLLASPGWPDSAAIITTTVILYPINRIRYLNQEIKQYITI